LRLAVFSPFRNRPHVTARYVSEVLARLARDYPCEVHLFAQQVAGLDVRSPGDPGAAESSPIIWHRVASSPGPQVMPFIIEIAQAQTVSGLV
jgi:hypothetical protein